MNEKINLKKEIISKVNNKCLQKYVVEFNTNSLPIDWNQWILLDEKIINLNLNTNGYFSLDKFGFVVIESFDEDFELEMGGNCMVFEKGRKYIPIFCGCYCAFIKINKGLKIFIGPGYADDFNNINSYCWTGKHHNDIDINIVLNGDIRGGNHLWYFLANFSVIYKNLNLKNNELVQVNNHFGMSSGMYGNVTNRFSNYNFISIDDFYSDYIKLANGLEDVVYFLDEFVQCDIIKILKIK